MDFSLPIRPTHYGKAYLICDGQRPIKAWLTIPARHENIPYSRLSFIASLMVELSLLLLLVALLSVINTVQIVVFIGGWDIPDIRGHHSTSSNRLFTVAMITTIS